MLKWGMKIAIIGTGISGLGAAWLLNRHHDVTIYEANQQAGGHSRTIDIQVENKTVSVDTGFIVFNHRNYPHLTAMFKYLDVPTSPSDMSFGASIEGGRIEYGSKGMFSQKANLLRPKFWGMVYDILRFNRGAKAYLNANDDMSLKDCLDAMGLGDWFRRYYLQAMGAAIWSCSVETILEYPASTFIRFFENHGLLTVNDHPQWYTVTGGSRSYVTRICAPFKDRIKTGCAVTAIKRTQDGVAVTDIQGQTYIYDHVVVAAHADQALAMLDAPSAAERAVLGAFRYQPNSVIVHTDTSFMPHTRGSWASWIYLSEGAIEQKPSVSLSYWMNNLQPLPTQTPVLVTLNPARRPKAALIRDEHIFKHPVFDLAAIRAQKALPTIQGQDRIWYCGAYQRFGFHEDGLLSAVNVAQALGADIPWA